MSIAGPSHTITDGLVFCIDQKNVKSYVGEPTINYQYKYEDSAYLWEPWTVSGSNIDVTGTADQGPVTGAKTWKFVKYGGSNQWNGWESSYGGIWTGIAGDIWTTSYWYKTSLAANIANFGIGGYYLSNLSRAYQTTILANISSVVTDGRWHYNYTTTRFDENYTNAIIVDGPSWGYSSAAGELFLNGLQWEKKPHPTPFAFRTRSATSGLLDLTRNNTIDLTNAGFNSSANISLNGSSEYFNIGTHTLGNQFTISAWVKPTSVSGDYVIVGTNANGCDNWFSITSGYIYVLSTEIADVNGFAVSGNTLLVENRWYYVCMTMNVSTINVYVNGVQDGTITVGFTIGSWNGGFCVGRRCPDLSQRYFPGEIGSVAFHTTVLTDAQILKEFNRTKTRYGY